MARTAGLAALLLAGGTWLAGQALAASPAGGTSGNFTPDTPFPAATPWTAPPVNDGGPLRFAVIGDRTGVARPGVFPQAMTQIGWLRPDFIIAVGDLIEGYSDDRAELEREWDEFDGYAARAGRPFIHVPGNHDLSNPLAVEVWRERHGQPWYAFTFKDALFIVLDTENPPTPMAPDAAASFHALVDLMNRDIAAGDKAVAERFENRPAPARETDVHIGAEQGDFVADVLARHRDVRWTFVFFHKPAWIGADPQWPRIEALLADRPYTVFAGHLHYFSHITRGGHDYVEMATTGAIAHRDGPGTLDHTMFVTLGPSGPDYANIRLNGLADLEGQTGQTHAH
jgi:3',5'-cyclic AMP phosphodiesterase CpdA